MIEGPAGAKPPAGGSGKRWDVGHLLEQVRERLDTVTRILAPAGRERVRTDLFLWRLQLAGRVFWVVLIGMGVYLLAELLWLKRQRPQLAARPQSASSPGLHGTVPVEFDSQLKPLSMYQQALVARNPFQLAPGRMADVVVDQTAKSQLADLVKSLTVVGISRGAKPEALIEDTEAKRTFFVRIGDEMNGLGIKAIDDRGVTVTYESQETILK
jgi:hypothetical protein